MLNMSALTQTLSAMSLPQLQQYASLHKDDPYVVTMALSIANQKKQIQTAAQGQAGQQPMPKVVDQEISQMAPRPAPMPENVGIGQLPAQNIAKMAGGGIVAFGEGGDVPRYNGTGSSFVGPVMSFQQFLASQGVSPNSFVNLTGPEQNALRDAYKSAGMGLPAGAQPVAAAPAANPTSAAKAPTGQAATAASAATPEAASGLKGLFNKIAPAAGRALGWGQVAMHSGDLNTGESDQLEKRRKYGALFPEGNAPDTIKALAQDPDITSKQFEQRVNAYFTSNPSQAPTTAGPAGAAIQGQGEGAFPGATTPGINALPTTSPTAAPRDRMAELQAQYKTITGGAPAAASAPGITALNTKPMSADEAKEAAGRLYTAAPLLGKIDEMRDAVEQDNNTRRAKLDAAIAAMPKYGVEAEQRIKAQEKELADDKKAAGWFAVLESGLATLAGTSPFAFANIGAGAQKGLGSYKDAMKDFKKLQLEYDKAQADIERARYAAKRDDFKLQQEFENSAAARMDNVRKIGVDAYGKVLQVGAETAAKVWDAGFAQSQQNLRTILTEQGATNRANALAKNQTALEMLRLAQPGAQEQLFTTLGKGDPVAGLKAYGDIMGPSTRSEATLLQKYMTPLGEANLRMMEAGTPEQQAEARQIRQRIKEAMGIGAISAVGAPASVNRP